MATLAEIRNFIRLPNDKIIAPKVDFESSLELTLPLLVNLAQAAYDGWASFMDTHWTAEVEYVRAEALAFTVVPNPDFPDPLRPDLPPKMRRYDLGPGVSVGAFIPGVRVGAPTTGQVAMAVSFKTNIPSRRRRGRIFLPGPPEGDVNADLLTGAYQTALQDSFEDWVIGIQNAAILGQSVTHVVVTLQDEADSAEPVSQRILRSRVDTQRRRLVKEA